MGRPKRVSKIRIDGDVAYVELTKGYEAMIDVADVPLVEGLSWAASVQRTTVYAVHNYADEGGQRACLRMHRVVVDAPVDKQVDHRDCNGLNNRRANLRLATGSQNQWNKPKYSSNKSGYKGVSWYAPYGKWEAKVQSHGVRYSLGYHDTPEEAYEAYCEAARRLHEGFFNGG